jgi:hypothetical protein
MITHSRSVYTQDAGFNEHRDCSVRALSVAACISYSDSHAIFAKHGRRARHGTPLPISSDVISALFPQAERIFLGGHITLSAFVAAHPKGHWIVATGSHMFAVCDSVVYDWDLHARCRIHWAWRVV